MSGYAGDAWEPPIGHLIDIAGTTVPPDYLLCDGSAISRTAYARLFNTIGTRYGAGDGSTTFNLPPFGNADTLRLPTGKRFSASMLNWLVSSAGGTVVLQSATQLYGTGANPNYGCTKAESGRKSGKVALAFSLSLLANPVPGMGYVYVGLSKWAGAVTATLTADIATNYHHYLRIKYTTTAGGAVTVNDVHQVNNGTATLLAGFTPAFSDRWYIRADLSSGTWDVRTSGGSSATLGASWSINDKWYPFIQFDSLNTIAVQFLTAANIAGFGDSALVAEYGPWADFADVLSGETSGSATHTHTIQGTTLAAAQAPAVTASSTLLVATGSNNVVAALQTAANASSSHTHTAVTASSMPPTVHALCAIKYR